MASNESITMTLGARHRSWYNSIAKMSNAGGWLKRKGRIIKATGREIRRNVSLINHSTSKAHPTGSEEISVAFAEQMDHWSWEYGMVSHTIGLTEKERLENSGDSKVLDILQTRQANVLSQGFDEWNVHFLAGAGGGGFSGATAPGWNTLNGASALAVAGTINGLFRPEARGSQTGNLGTTRTIARGAVAGAEFRLQHGQADGNDDFSVGGLKSARDLVHGCKLRAGVTRKGLVPYTIDGAVVREAFAQNLRESLTTFERIVDRKSLDLGHWVTEFAGVELIEDNDMPTSAVADEEFSMYVIPSKMIAVEAFNFLTMGKEVPMERQISSVWTIKSHGQLTWESDLAGFGVMVDANTN